MRGFDILRAGLLVSAVLCATQAFAQSGDADPADPSRTEEGLDLLGEGARLLFEGLTEDLRPQLEALAEQMEPALRSMVEDMGPALNDLAEMIGDLSAYHPPERLPNGDIILRRKTPLPPEGAETAPEGPVDL